MRGMNNTKTQYDYTCSKCKTGINYNQLAGISIHGSTCKTCAAEYATRKMAKAQKRTKPESQVKAALILEGWAL